MRLFPSTLEAFFRSSLSCLIPTLRHIGLFSRIFVPPALLSIAQRRWLYDFFLFGQREFVRMKIPGRENLSIDFYNFFYAHFFCCRISSSSSIGQTHFHFTCQAATLSDRFATLKIVRRDDTISIGHSRRCWMAMHIYTTWDLKFKDEKCLKFKTLYRNRPEPAAAEGKRIKVASVQRK